ncbi:zinc-binding dehydrogenase [Streptomyces sp. NPDC054841]
MSRTVPRNVLRSGTTAPAPSGPSAGAARSSPWPPRPRPTWRPRAAELGLRAGFTIVEPDHSGLKEIAALVESGGLRVEIDTVLPLEQAAKAHEIGESGRTKGKIVLTVAG